MKNRPDFYPIFCGFMVHLLRTTSDHNQQFSIVGASILPGVRRVQSDVPILTVDGATPPHALLVQPEISGLAMRSSEESVSGVPNNRGFRILPGGRLLGRATGSFCVPRVFSFAGIPRVESEDMMRQLSQENLKVTHRQRR